MTATERKRRERLAKRKAGLVPKEVWCTREQWPRIVALLKRQPKQKRVAAVGAITTREV